MDDDMMRKAIELRDELWAPKDRRPSQEPASVTGYVVFKGYSPDGEPIMEAEPSSVAQGGASPEPTSERCESVANHGERCVKPSGHALPHADKNHRPWPLLRTASPPTIDLAEAARDVLIVLDLEPGKVSVFNNLRTALESRFGGSQESTTPPDFDVAAFKNKVQDAQRCSWGPYDVYKYLDGAEKLCDMVASLVAENTRLTGALKIAIRNAEHIATNYKTLSDDERAGRVVLEDCRRELGLRDGESLIQVCESLRSTVTRLEKERQGDLQKAVDFAERKQDEIRELSATVTRQSEALQKIAAGEGRYSRDPLTHAENTIDDMKALASNALTPPTPPKNG